MTTHQPSNQDLIRAILEIQQDTAVKMAESGRRLDILGAKLDQEREERLAQAEQVQIERLAMAERLEQDRQAWRSGFDDTINLVSQGITQLGNKIDALGDKIDTLGNKIERLIQAVIGYQGNGQ